MKFHAYHADMKPGKSAQADFPLLLPFSSAQKKYGWLVRQVWRVRSMSRHISIAQWVVSAYTDMLGTLSVTEALECGQQGLLDASVYCL